MHGIAARFFNRSLIAGLFLWVVVVSFSGYYATWGFFDKPALTDHYRDFVAIIDGTADRPYVYRRLIPSIANSAERVTPRSLQDALGKSRSRSGTPFYRAFFDSAEALNPSYSFRYFIFYAEVFLSALLAIFSAYFVCRMSEIRPLPSACAAIFLILLMPYFSIVGGGEFYDYAEVAFCALALSIALRFSWWWLVPLAVLGEWNKESFLFFVIALYPILRRSKSRVEAMLCTGVLVTLCGMVYLAIQSRFQHNPGGVVAHHFADQLRFYTHAVSIVGRPEKLYGFPVLSPHSILPLGFLGGMVWFGWKYLPLELRRHAQLAAAINLPLYLLFCSPGEIRNLSLLYMTLLLCFAHNFARMENPVAVPVHELSDAEESVMVEVRSL
ncbi:MAG TPA: hypothetical protein VGB69_03650 [Edaphobacter sp.]